MSAPLLAIGIDPGASASVTAVIRRRGALPLLLGSWSVWGGASTWEQRLGAMRLDLGEYVENHLAEGRPVRAALEVPGGQGRSRRGSRGPASFWRMMQAGGRIEQAIRDMGAELFELTSNEWPRAVGVRVGKSDEDEGAHRIDEARRQVDGFGAMVDGLDRTSKSGHERAVCLAESALMASAVCNLTPWPQR